MNGTAAMDRIAEARARAALASARELSCADSRAAFMAKVGAIASPNDRVLDLGAGSGSWYGRSSAERRRACSLKGRVGQVIGIDLDPAVVGNPTLDSGLFMKAEQLAAMAPGRFDLVMSYAVLEHVAEPESFAASVATLLRPGGWFCAWTPNRWGYVGVGARAVPSRFHAGLLKRVSPGDTRREADVFPTVYRMNTVAAIERLFPGWKSATVTAPGPGSYNLGCRLLAAALRKLDRAVPSWARSELHIFVQKPGEALR